MTARLDKLISAVLPLPFVGAAFLNILVYPLGLHAHDSVRTLLVFGLLGAVALLLLGRVVLLWRRMPELRRFSLWTACIPALYGVFQLWSFLLTEDRISIFKETLVNGCTLVSVCCVMIIILAETRLRSFLHNARIYALVLSPIILYYCIRFYLPGAEDSVQNLGTVEYMSLAYTLLELSVFLLVEVFLYDTGEKKAADFFPVNFALTLLFSVAIALSGTKGTILCLLLCILCVFAARILSRMCIRIYTRTVLLAASSCLALLLFSTVLFPNNNVNNRFLTFWKELTPSASVTITEEDRREVAEIIGKTDTVAQESGDNSPEETEASIERADSSTPSAASTPDTDDGEGHENMNAIVDSVLSGKAKEDLTSGAITQEEYDALNDMAKKLNNTATGARKYLWASALTEIRSAPLLGHGPHSFQEKYGTYPHNFFLELATDFGLPVTLAVLLGGLYVFLRLFRVSRTSRLYAAFLLYVIAFLPRAMLSGSIYSSSVFFQYGFCILLACSSSCRCIVTPESS